MVLGDGITAEEARGEILCRTCARLQFGALHGREPAAVLQKQMALIRDKRKKVLVSVEAEEDGPEGDPGREANIAVSWSASAAAFALACMCVWLGCGCACWLVEKNGGAVEPLRLCLVDIYIHWCFRLFLVCRGYASFLSSMYCFWWPESRFGAIRRLLHIRAVVSRDAMFPQEAHDAVMLHNPRVLAFDFPVCHALSDKRRVMVSPRVAIR